MLKWLVILTAVVSLRGQGLEPGPQPGEGEVPVDRKQVRRFLPYSIPFYPYVTYQPVVYHHVVMLPPPNCQPGSLPGSLPGTQTGTQPGTLPGTLPGTQPGTQSGTQQPSELPGYPQVQPEPQPAPELGFKLGMPKRPSRCVWAIVACCSPDAGVIRYTCFEMLGCPGAFWGVNPCEAKVVKAAANTALAYYSSGGVPEGNDV